MHSLVPLKTVTENIAEVSWFVWNNRILRGERGKFYNLLLIVQNFTRLGIGEIQKVTNIELDFMFTLDFSFKSRFKDNLTGATYLVFFWNLIVSSQLNNMNFQTKTAH